MCKTFFPETESMPDRIHSVRPVPITIASYSSSIVAAVESVVFDEWLSTNLLDNFFEPNAVLVKRAVRNFRWLFLYSDQTLCRKAFRRIMWCGDVAVICF